MKTLALALSLGSAVAIGFFACTTASAAGPQGAEKAQVPTWSPQDMEFFLHGSMSTEVVPEPVLRAFIRVYPDLFPTADLSHLGLIPDPEFGWPVGFSRNRPAHLAGMSAVGINCAACHVAEIESPAGSSTRVLGGTANFDAEAFFGSVIVAMFRTVDPANMKRFMLAYLDENDAEAEAGKRAERQARFAAAWDGQAAKIAAAIAADPAGAQNAGPGGLQDITPQSVQLTGELLAHDVDLAQKSAAMLRLFHNMRAALHVPDKPPEKLPPASGPGRNDAFGLLSAILFASPQPYSPVKYGLVWNVEHRPWVHWDGNTRSPIGRNLLAALGLGAPLIGREGKLDFALIKRQTDLSEKILPPKYPFVIDRDAAERGGRLYQVSCASCHNGAEGDHRLYSPKVVGTDLTRADIFTPAQAEKFNTFLARFETPGYSSAREAGIRSTGKYLAPNLAGAWARSPYLHNGSVRTMQELLTTPASRAVNFHRGSRLYDAAQMGFTDAGPYIFDTKAPGNSNSGHDYGTGLSADQKRDLIEYLRSL